MFIWLLLSVLVVVAVKFYTAKEIANLERQLKAVTNSLHTKRSQFQMANEKQQTIQEEETEVEQRLLCLKEIVQDINIRLMEADHTSTTVAANTSSTTGKVTSC